MRSLLNAMRVKEQKQFAAHESLSVKDLSVKVFSIFLMEKPINIGICVVLPYESLNFFTLIFFSSLFQTCLIRVLCEEHEKRDNTKDLHMVFLLHIITLYDRIILSR